MANIFEDFEWGNDEDLLSDAGGTIAWSIWAAGGTSNARIDTAQKYQGTRSGRLYHDGSNALSLYCTKTAGSGYEIAFWLNKQDAAQLSFLQGNGTYTITFQVRADESIIYYDTDFRVVGTATKDVWQKYQFNNINFAAGTFDIWLQGVKIKSGAVMRTENSNVNQITFANLVGESSLWIDNFRVSNWPVSQSLSKLVAGGLLG